MKIIRLINSKEFALVDDADFEWLNQWKWRISKHGDKFYIRKVGGSREYMHRLINNTQQGYDTDHKDGNTFNNQRNNLRKSTKSENQMNRGKQKNNTSGFKGVTFMGVNNNGYKLKNPWVARIKAGTKYISLGLFKTPEEAARAYNEAAKKYHGEFARLNEA